jgi:hypothetical protein
MTSTNPAAELVLAGRPIDREEAWTRVLRYCGLPWGDNPPETWAFRYYDAIETDPTLLTSVDVVSAGALHPGISRDDLAYFWDHRDELTSWLDRFPVDLELRAADDATIEQLAELPTLFQGPSLSLLTKVLHRKRPWLIPVIDREVIDLCRPLTGQRRAADAWSPLLHHLADDLQTNRDTLAEFRLVLRMLHGLSLSDVRTADIIIWMGGQR